MQEKKHKSTSQVEMRACGEDGTREENALSEGKRTLFRDARLCDANVFCFSPPLQEAKCLSDMATLDPLACLICIPRTNAFDRLLIATAERGQGCDPRALVMDARKQGRVTNAHGVCEAFALHVEHEIRLDVDAYKSASTGAKSQNSAHPPICTAIIRMPKRTCSTAQLTQHVDHTWMVSYPAS
jgi:hypothetical protein